MLKDVVSTGSLVAVNFQRGGKGRPPHSPLRPEDSHVGHLFVPIGIAPLRMLTCLRATTLCHGMADQAVRPHSTSTTST